MESSDGESDDSSNFSDDHGRDSCRGRCVAAIKTSELSTRWYVFKWLAPGFAFAGCFLFQNYCLHLGTYYYVQWMGRLEHNLMSNTTEATFTGETLSSEIYEGALHDPLEDLLDPHPVPMLFLDMISACVPFVWLVSTIYKVDLHLWTKCCLCGCLLAILKGILCIATVVPDSIGWRQCKQRLGPDGVRFFQDPRNVQFENALWASIWDMFYLEVIGLVEEGKARHLRFCADMVYSGHTYFVTLFAIGLYDLIKKNFFERRHRESTPIIFLYAAAFLLAAVVLTDVVLILLNRFHYTIDIILALLLVYLHYTSAPINRFAAIWADELWVPKSKRRAVASLGASRTGGAEVMVPPCFPPFCLMSGRYAVMEEEKNVVENFINSYLQHNPEEYLQVLKNAIEYKQEPGAGNLKSFGDVDMQTIMGTKEQVEEALKAIMPVSKGGQHPLMPGKSKSGHTLDELL